MKNKCIRVWLLAILSVFCLSFCVSGVLFAGNNKTYAEDTEQTGVKEYTVGSVSVHFLSDHSKIYMMFYDGDGNGLALGYDNWVNPDEYTAKFKEYMTVDGVKMSEIEGVTVQGMDISNALCISGSGFSLSAGGKVVIVSGAVFENEHVKLTFNKTYTITWSGESYSVETAKEEDTFPDYTMEDGMLSDFTSNSIIRLGGQKYADAVPDKSGWVTNYQGSFFQGGFVSAEEAPEGSVNGGYKFSWETTTGLLYPSIMFRFRNDIAFENDDELVLRIYISETIDNSFSLWITSSTNPKVWEAENTVSGLTLTTGGWNEITVPVADYLDDEGKIAPIAFTFYYAASYNGGDDVPGGYLVFDTAIFKHSEKVVDEDYKIYDVSEIIPLTGAKTFTGELAEYSENFDYEKDCNIAFARTDKAVTGMKAKVSINNLDRFSFYFVLNGNAKYFTEGGIYFWFGNDSVLVGTASKAYINEPLPETIKANTPFEVEMTCTPYYINGMKAGYYAALKIDGTEIGKAFYASSASCNFGTWTGLYLHNTTKDVNVTVAPVTQTGEEPMSLTLSTSLNETSVAIGGNLATKVKVSCKLYNQGSVNYVVVSGEKFARIDEEGYIIGLADGKAVVKAVITNEFGEFSSNEIEITVGTGEEAKEENKGGCKSSLGSGMFMLSVLALGAATVIFKKRCGKKDI